LAFQKSTYEQLYSELKLKGVELIAVSKTKPNSDLMEGYESGVRDFGENYVQELTEKATELPKDIRWHFIGHLQTNKVKYIAPFVHLIHGVDSEKLLLEINKQGKKNKRIIHCLLQIHIATEESKFGLNASEFNAIVQHHLLNQSPEKLEFVSVDGLMGMASFTEDKNKIRAEFSELSALFQTFINEKDLIHSPTILSMGMSSDYPIAIENGSNMIRVGSLLFGQRNYTK
jgi:pyridoxal phosphate enzyme (YggS family)